MIVIVNSKSYKKLIVKLLSYVGLLIMFYFYYNHMSNKFQQQNEKLKQSLNIAKTTKKNNISKENEQIIYKEAVIITNLIDQKYIESMKIVKDRLLIICDPNTNIEPLMVRYGVKAYIKDTQKNIKIAIDLSTIMEKKND